MKGKALPKWNGRQIQESCRCLWLVGECPLGLPRVCTEQLWLPGAHWGSWGSARATVVGGGAHWDSRGARSGQKRRCGLCPSPSLALTPICLSQFFILLGPWFFHLRVGGNSWAPTPSMAVGTAGENSAALGCSAPPGSLGPCHNPWGTDMFRNLDYFPFHISER